MTRLPWLLHSDLGDDMAEGKASPGSPFKPPAAVIWNNMVDAGRAWADSRLNGGAPNPIRPRETDIIKAKNTSGAARRLGEILRIDGKAIETVTDENKWLLGVEPTDDGYFGILKEPVENNGLASLQVSGCCMALVNVTDADHKRATSAEGEYVLQSGDDGPIEILFAPEGTGEKTCVVRFAGSGGGGAVISDGIVRIVHACGVYTIELGELQDVDESASGSGPNCNPCDDGSGSGSGCELILSPPPQRVVGNGTFVVAFDPQSITIPLAVNTDCVVGKVSPMASSSSGSGAGSGSGASTVTPWRVLSGYQEHIVQYRERWDCCAPDGPPVLIGKTPIVLVGKECAEIICGECPPSSGSA